MTDENPKPGREIIIDTAEEKRLRQELENKKDAESERMKRFLNIPDLAHTPGSPLHEMVRRISQIPDFQDLDHIQVPEIVPTDITFDLFDFPADHPARSKSDTYYVDEKNILRTHTTIMWYYYLNDPEVKQRIANNQAVGALCYGKVYRKDEIDRHHMNVFHQIDGWYLAPKSEKVIEQKDLEQVLGNLARAVFGPDVKYRLNKDTFPYTDPSLEMEIEANGKWVEVVGSGVVKGSVLDKLGVDSSKYTGWAFGFGLERLAIISMELPDIRLLWSKDERVKKQLNLGQKFVEVSKYPPVIRDISFIVDKGFQPNDYFDLIRDIGGDLVEEVQLTDKYENAEKFGADKVSYTYRIMYRSPERTLEAAEVEPLQDQVYKQTAEQFKAQLR
jgi:phenylalanyl-tRNA synthetase alpha chain